jgi:hypothetical protein
MKSIGTQYAGVFGKMGAALCRCCLFLFFLWGDIPGTAAQQYNTLFWMQGIPQSNYANPALQPQALYHAGMPALSSLYLNTSNHGFSVADMVGRDELDEKYWDPESLLQALDDHNLLQANAYMEWFSFGLKSRANYFSFNFSEKIDYHMAYPEELARLVLQGNDGFTGSPEADAFSGFEMDHLHFRELGMSYSREVSPSFSFGFRGRALFGIRNQSTDKAAFELAGGPAGEDILLHTEVRLNHTSGQSLNLNGDHPFQLVPAYELNDFRVNFKNLGAALDLGFVLHPAGRFSFAVSVLDLGFIDWKDGVENYIITGSSEFDGIDPEHFFNSRFISNMESFLDGIPDYFQVRLTQSKYRSTLSPKVLGSVGMALSERHQLALLSRNLFYNGRVFPSFTFSYNVKPSDATGFSLSYSVANRSYANIGLGMYANLGPFQFYVVGDNLLGFIIPNHAHWNSLHLGFNWVFGYRPEIVEPDHTW